MFSSRKEAEGVALEFLYNVNKPDWARPVDILLTANIILCSNEEMVCRASQGVLAAMCGIKKVDSVAASLVKLVEHGWIVKRSGKGQWQTNYYEAQLHTLPLGGFRQKLVSETAKSLAARYREMIRLIPKKLSKSGRYYGVRINKGWPQHWSFIMQGWLDAGFSDEQISRVVDYAFANIADTAKHGPHTLKRKFKTLAQKAGVTSIPQNEIAA